MTRGVTREALHPKNAGLVVRFDAVNPPGVVGTGGKEYSDGKSAARDWVVCKRAE